MQSLSSSQPFITNSTIPVQSPNSSNFTRNLSFPAKFSTTQFNSCRNRKRVSINSKFNGLQFVGFCSSHSFSNFRTTQFGSLGCVNCKKIRVLEVNCVVGRRKIENLGKLRAVVNVDELRLGFGSLGYVNCTKVCSFMSDGLSSGFCNSESGLRNQNKFRVFEVNCVVNRRKMGNLGRLRAVMNVDGLSSGYCNSESGLRNQNKFRVFEVNCVVNRRKMGNLGKLRAVMNVDELSSGFCNSESGLRNQNKVRVLGRLGFCNSESGLRNQNKFRVLRAVMNVDDEVVGGEISGGEDMEKYDAIVIGSGIGGLVAGTQLAVKGAKVLVLEKYVIPGGSSGFYERDGYTFDVGSSVMFGFSDQGNLNLITQALAAVGHKMEVIPDPTTVHFHLPNNLSVLVHRYYEDFVTELTSKFPHEKDGILKFYGVCWKIFNALNSLELKSLEEPLYLFGQFFQKPLECLTLAFYLPQNAGAIARKYIKDPELLSFIDAECFIVSTVNALQTPMINASMVLCDRHFGGINYPVGGVGGIAKSLAQGLVDQGSKILYKANVTSIILEHGKAVGVRLSDGREFYARTIISNATRWDTFGKLLKSEKLPKEEESFQKLYVQAPSFLSIHMGVKAEVLPPDTDCHHFILETDWKDLEKPYGSIFLSIPTVLDPSLAPKGHHILHIFTTSSIDDWQGLSRAGYNEKKELIADEIISRLEKKLFPGLKSSITFIEVGTPKTHRRYLARDNGTYGPMPRAVPKGLLGMPFNTTAIDGLYCVGDSCFPGQGVIAVAFSGIMCAHRVAADTGFEKSSPVLDAALLRLLGWFRTLA